MRRVDGRPVLPTYDAILIADIEHQRETLYVPDNWNRESWIRYVRHMAIRCREFKPHVAAAWTAYADALAAAG